MPRLWSTPLWDDEAVATQTGLAVSAAIFATSALMLLLSPFRRARGKSGEVL